MAPRNQVSFSDDEYDQLANLLSILVLNLVEGVEEIKRYQVGTRIEERLRQQTELATTFIARIESR